MESPRTRRTGKAGKPKSYDLFSLFTFFLPGPWGSLLLVAGVLILQVLSSIVYAIPYSMGLMSMDTLSLLSYATTFALLLIPCATISREKAFRAQAGVALSSRHFGKSGMLPVLLLGAVGMVGASMALEPVSSLIERLIEPSDLFRSSMELLSKGNVWIISLQVCILAPLFEEILCRGIILRGMLSRIRPGWAIVLSALYFALMHANIWQGFGAFVLGALLGYAYYKTGSLALTMLMHAANNTFGLALMRYTADTPDLNWTDILPVWGYAGLVAVGLLLTALLVRVLSRIPKEHPHGNLDPVVIEDLMA